MDEQLLPEDFVGDDIDISFSSTPKYLNVYQDVQPLEEPMSSFS